MFDYGLWDVVIVNSAIFLIFAFSFTRPRTSRDWRSFGAFSAFVVALFTEMYGFPLTIYLLSGWLGSLNPAANLFAHDSGHIWQTLFGLGSDPHQNPIHFLSDALLAGGFIVVASAWPVLLRAQRSGRLASGGIYSLVRHPQYVGFITVMFSFLLEWPTIPTLVMFPILVTMYLRLAKREEREAIEHFGEEYLRYMERTSGFFPRPWRLLRSKPHPAYLPDQSRREA